MFGGSTIKQMFAYNKKVYFWGYDAHVDVRPLCTIIIMASES